MTTYFDDEQNKVIINPRDVNKVIVQEQPNHVEIGIGGPQGIQGVQGVQGRQGITGIQGNTGIQGSTGAQGTQGTTGIQGTAGFTGANGTQGTQGIQGVQGRQGTQGITGIQGFGYAQLQGPLGFQGTTGSQGTQGITGIQGFGYAQLQGPLGFQGTTGSQGTQGTQGTTGFQGTTGSQGITGDNGIGYDNLTSSSSVVMGTSAKTFSMSSTGALALGTRVRISPVSTPNSYMDGPITAITANSSITVTVDLFSGSGTFTSWTVSVVGQRGAQGTQGATGVQGTQGTIGPQGLTGSQGTTGTTGDTGLQGATGSQGITGDNGIGYDNLTSSSSVVMGTSAKIFSMSSTGALALGTRVRISPVSTPNSYMDGPITAITANSSITVTVDLFSGSGTFTSWTVSVVGQRGAQGTQGATGVQGTQGTVGTQGLQGLKGDIGNTGIQGTTGASGDSSSHYHYNARTNTTSGDPTTNQLGWNNATQIDSTALRVNHLDADSQDNSVFLDLINQYDVLIIQDKNDATNYQKWEVSGTPTYNPTWDNFPVTLITSAGTGTTNFASNHSLLFIIVSVGNVGPQGIQGTQGTIGPQGLTGSQGTTGTTGLQGATGSQGTTGLQGIQGLQGTNATDTTWSAWTPTLTNFTQGTGAVSQFFYTQIGKTIIAQGYCTLGTGTTSPVGGQISFTLPVNHASSNRSSVVGQLLMRDSSPGTSYIGNITLTGSAPAQANFQLLNASGTYLTAGTQTSSAPFTWADSDYFSFVIVYQGV
jgi:hypothetical protein